MGGLDIENSLIQNIKNFVRSAKLVYDSRDYTSATIIYFKTLFSVADLMILRKKGVVSKDHSQRFRLLEEDFPDIYFWLDKNFEIYRNSYNVGIEKEECDKIREYVESVIEKQKI